MGRSRREFLKSTTTAAAAGIAAHLPIGRFAADALVSPSPSPYSPVVAEPSVKELAQIAPDAAKSVVAECGFGIRTLVGGARGYTLGQRTILGVGPTRDGTVTIERRRITKLVKNLRISDSPVFLLIGLEALGVPEGESASEGGNSGQAITVPPVTVRTFNFTSLSDAA